MGNLNKVTYTDHQTVITAANLNDIQDSVIQNTSYTTCSTAAGTAAKTATLANFVLTTGSAVRVKFTNANTANNPTLNINSTGAKSIMKFGTTAAGATETSSWEAGEIVTFVYDGTNWLMADFSRLSSLGLGGINDNLWDNSVNILNVGTPRYNGGNFRVYGNANSYPLSLPSAISPAITSGEVVCYRQSFCQFTSSLVHATVVLYEVYPVAGRIWINTYNTSWSGWRTVMFTDGGTFTEDVTINKNRTGTNLGISVLTLGNNIPNGTAGNSYGVVRLYGKTNQYTNLSASDSTATRGIALPDASGTVALVETTVPKTGGTFTNNVTIAKSGGTAGTTNYSYLYLGNSTNISAADHAEGVLRIMGQQSYYSQIYPVDTLSTNRTIRLPDASGTVALSRYAYQYLGSVTKSNSVIYDIPSGYQWLMHVGCLSTTTGDSGLYSMRTNSNGTIYITPFIASSHASFTTAANKLTITCSAYKDIYIGFIGSGEITVSS